MIPLRVLHVVTSLESGGMENGICNVARVLTARGIQTSVACLERGGPFAARLPDPGAVDLLGKRDGFSPYAVLGLWKAIRRRRPHVVHTHNLGPLIYGALATFFGRTRPLIQGEHSQLAPWELTPKRLAQRRRLYRACRTIHTVSHAQRDELVRLGFAAEKITAIPNGVDTTRFRPGDRADARARLGLSASGTVVGLVGRFGPHKGHRAFLRAFETVALEAPDCVAIFIGGGGSEEQAIAREVAAHRFRARLHLAGFQSSPEHAYPALDLLAVPSTNEGMSNAVLEAMACGVPVLANINSGNEALITDGIDGWIGDLHAPESIARALGERLRQPEELEKFRAPARQAVEARFSLAPMAQAYENLYRRLAT